MPLLSSRALPPGTPAPAFTLPAEPGRTVSLESLQGRPVVLAFYPADWSPVCGDQMALYNELLPECDRLGAELLGISVDGRLVPRGVRRGPQPAVLRSWPTSSPRARSPGATGSIAPPEGTSERALFVIDGDGIIRWSYVSPGRRESRRRRHPRGAGKLARITARRTP